MGFPAPVPTCTTSRGSVPSAVPARLTGCHPAVLHSSGPHPRARSERHLSPLVRSLVMDGNMVLLIPGSQLVVLTQQPLRGTPEAGDRVLAGPESSATRFLLQPRSLD